MNSLSAKLVNQIPFGGFFFAQHTLGFFYFFTLSLSQQGTVIVATHQPRDYAVFLAYAGLQHNKVFPACQACTNQALFLKSAHCSVMFRAQEHSLSQAQQGFAGFFWVLFYCSEKLQRRNIFCHSRDPLRIVQRISKTLNLVALSNSIEQQNII